MQHKHLFEYAVIRIVPRVEREEFINVGVILYCKDERFLSARFLLDRERLHAFAPLIEPAELEANLNAICNICRGTPDSGPIGQLALPERFRWLTAIRSTAVQTSRVHPGFCSNAEEMLEKLYTQLVL